MIGIGWSLYSYQRMLRKVTSHFLTQYAGTLPVNHPYSEMTGLIGFIYELIKFLNNTAAEISNQLGYWEKINKHTIYNSMIEIKASKNTL